MIRPPRTRALPRALALAACLLPVALVAAGCDTSPYAFSVNSQVVKQAAVDSELKLLAANPTYVSQFDRDNSVSNGGNGTGVAGDADGTYSSTWVANVLSILIRALIVHQHLAAAGDLPDQLTLDAARSVLEATFPDWSGLPGPFRDSFVQRLAELAQLVPPAPAAQIRPYYDRYREWFFSQICLVQATVADEPSASALSASGSLPGTPQCYRPSELDSYPSAFSSAVVALKVGQLSAPIQTPFGYEVVKLTSRSDLGFSPQVQRVVTVASNAATQSAGELVIRLYASARVRVNPAYGIWSQTASVVIPPQQPAFETTTTASPGPP